MSDAPTSFLAVVFPSTAAAEDALAEIRAPTGEGELELHDAAIVSRSERGAVELAQSREIATGEAVVGAGTAGLVAGLLLGVPVGGALLGLLGGAALGLRDTGIPDERMRKLGEDLAPGQAVLCLLVKPGSRDRARAALDPYGSVLEVELDSGSDP